MDASKQQRNDGEHKGFELLLGDEMAQTVVQTLASPMELGFRDRFSCPGKAAETRHKLSKSSIHPRARFGVVLAKDEMSKLPNNTSIGSTALSETFPEDVIQDPPQKEYWLGVDSRKWRCNLIGV